MPDVTHRYTAIIDPGAVRADTMTDAGLPVRDLDPVENALLTPGDPSPVGRTGDGDLAYPVLADATQLRLERIEIAQLAYLQACHAGISNLPEYPIQDPGVWLFARLLREAVPRQLFAESQHGRAAMRHAEHAVLVGDWAAYPDFLKSARHLAGPAD